MNLKKYFQKIKFFFLPCRANKFRPGISRDGFLFSLLVIFFAFKILILAFSFYFPKNIFFAQIVKGVLIDLVNKERVDLGLSPLREDPRLDQAAYFKAQDMLKNQYFSHISPQGKDPWYWFKKAGYDYQIAGENLAIGFIDSEEVFEAWKNSGSHRQNLFSPYFEDVGIAIVKGNFQDQETIIVVQLFGASRTSPIASAQEPPSISSSVGEEKETSYVVEPTPEEPPLIEEEEKNTDFSQEQTEPLSVPQPEESAKKSFGQPYQLRFWRFVAERYDEVISKIILYSLSFLIVFFIFSFAFGLDYGVFYYDLLSKTLIIFVFILFSQTILDKNILINLIPHQLRIY